ncbi:YebC/PmpR family DNA-binding transcriptional regulator [Candidatus Palibaumannia cicadellinicola]|uniref:Probable transcriptional regulatory protein CEX73_02125 n=1 Tax=Candidatus Palibaumannia cicadellinicola TaxID=186490 RepID=A0A2N4XWQ0_9GAMM|nr:YebC/PmpR family DNA-binding transcriptional regulator [Candidatus Baumannia cicadellinicola]PLK58518.1 YebC/PmpR family DNA-binding transcriptional regulator [Candidatus Baumannia cicadellinicola]
MAGHSKWANTKHRKATQNVKRGKIFTKIIRELVTAARLGGENINFNPRLRAAVDKALSHNMTRETLNRAIARGIGDADSEQIETIYYEGYGPGGTAIMVECLSNNRRRTVSTVRHAFTKVGGHLVSEGSVAYLFNKKGVISFAPGLNENTLIDIALEASADDVVINTNGMIDVYTTFELLDNIKNTIQKAGLTAISSKVAFIPSIHIDINEENTMQLHRLIEILEDSDDVQEVYHNGKIFYAVTE